jgi:LmbE family N-acetylglucosaminyl deacetylase
MHRIELLPAAAGLNKRILALGAHCDDIEIGCGGTMLRRAAERPDLEVLWVVFGSTPERAAEARASAEDFLTGFSRWRLLVHEFRDGYLPYAGAELKDTFEALKKDYTPDIIFTHYRDDRHQDHRIVSELTWNTWRNHLVLEYEVPKYDGDFGSPSVFAPLPAAVVDRKVDIIMAHFQTQANKHWLSRDLFHAVARIRGMECVAPEEVAEAFYSRKVAF